MVARPGRKKSSAKAVGWQPNRSTSAPRPRHRGAPRHASPQLSQPHLDPLHPYSSIPKTIRIPALTPAPSSSPCHNVSSVEEDVQQFSTTEIRPSSPDKTDVQLPLRARTPRPPRTKRSPPNSPCTTAPSVFTKRCSEVLRNPPRPHRTKRCSGSPPCPSAPSVEKDVQQFSAPQRALRGHKNCSESSKNPSAPSVEKDVQQFSVPLRALRG